MKPTISYNTVQEGELYQVWANSKRNLIGSIQRERGIWLMNGLLASNLMLTSEYDPPGEEYGAISTQDLPAMKKIIERAYTIRCKIDLKPRFIHERDTGSYKVIHRELEIGKILRVPTDEGMQGWTLSHYLHSSTFKVRYPKRSYIYYYWILDGDLCQFLGLPHCDHPNSYTLHAVKQFIAMRLHKPEKPEPIYVTLNDKRIKAYGPPTKEYNHPAGCVSFTSMIAELTHRERIRRRIWVMSKREV